MRRTAFFSALALTSLLSDCSPRRATAIVLWIDTDIPNERFGAVEITVTGHDRDGAVVMYEGRRNSPSPNGPWPGAIVLAPNESKNVVSVDVQLHYTPLGMTNGTPFDQKAIATFARGEWRQLTMLIADQCTDPSVEQRCRAMNVNGQEFTCGSADPNNPCINVQRGPLQPFDPSSAVPDATVRNDASQDAGAFDVPTVDMPMVGADVIPANIDPPLLRWPPTGARVRGLAPKFRVYLNTGTSADIEICPTPMCDTTTEFYRVDDMYRTLPARPMPMHYWWRAWGVSQNVRGTRPSPTRLFVTTPGTIMGGTTIGRIADISGDGHGDYFVGRPGIALPSGGLAGSVNPFATNSGVINSGRGAFTPDANPPHQRYGAAITVCDFNGDSRLDFAVGAPGGVSDNLAGQVYVYTAQADGSFVQQGAALTAGGIGDLFGFSLTSGDLNADGRCDLVVGAPTSIPLGMMQPTGQVFVFAGHSMDVITRSPVTIVGRTPNEKFGVSVASGADFNGDNIEDFVVGAPHGNSDTGRVQIVFSNGAVGLGESMDIVPNNGIPDLGSNFGHTVSILGDVNGDGRADVGISAPVYDDLGAAYVVLGRATFVANLPSPELLQLPRDPSVMITQSFGWTVTGVGSIDGDDRDDILVGIPNAAPNGAVQIHRCFQCANTALYVLRGPTANSTFGWSALGLGDINEDRVDDFLVGIPFAANPLIPATPAQSIGSLQLFRGTSAAPGNAIQLTPSLSNSDPDPDRITRGEWGSVFQR